MRRLRVLVVAAGLVLALFAMASCGGDDDTAGGDGTPSPTATSSPASDDAATVEDGTEPTDGTVDDGAAADVDALCQANDELVAFMEQELAGFGPGSDPEAARAVVADLEVRFTQMSQLAPAELQEDLERYGSAVAAVIDLSIDADFDTEAIPQDQIDAFVREYPDLNLFESSPVEERIRSWFTQNCPTPFAF